MAQTKKNKELDKLDNIPKAFRFTQNGFAVDDNNYEGKFLYSPVSALYELGFKTKPKGLDGTGIFLHLVAESFLSKIPVFDGIELLRDKAVIPLDYDNIVYLLERVPFAPGAEYVNDAWLNSLWTKLNEHFALEIKEYPGTVSLYLAEKSQHLKVAEKIFFHLVENPLDTECPFSFMATYSTKDEDGKVSHVPLRYALVEFKDDRKKMLELLSCLNKVAEVSPLIEGFIKNGELFHPLRINTQEAYSLLKIIPDIEKIGIVFRIPDWWKKKKHSVSLSIRLGEKEESLLGLESIISMDSYLSVDGMELSEAEIEALQNKTDGLALIKGKWVEVDHERLNALLSQVEHYKGKLSLLEALRMNLQTEPLKDDDSNEDSEENDEVIITNGAWLSELFKNIRSSHTETENSPPPPESFKAVLRPYQQAGFTWLERMYNYGLGACLADDMGLGKTVQVLAFLDALRMHFAKQNVKNPHILLVVPASLLGNWQKECAKFAPAIDVRLLHSSSKSKENQELAFLNITTYSMASRLEVLTQTEWDMVILDEAQAIKNPLSKQTKSIKALNCHYRVAMTGTPVENDLTNLWSLFDFLDKGLLGTSTEFKDFCKTLTNNPEGYTKLKNMIMPFMLRRLKTDKSIISDLPEKIEMIDYVSLSKKQRVLYKKYVDDIEEMLNNLNDEDSNIKRSGIILSSLIKLKQICNHPDQFTGSEGYAEGDSGKFEILRELCSTIYEKRERVLIFTQFKEVCEPLNAFLSKIFGIQGFVLHGGTSVKTRNKMVEEFQSDKYIPYMIISVKAGGTGLTLTNANHVIHFDRWWNPAVENQATDRAFRIGQKKNVIVHKLVCKGTIEEKINELIERKKTLSQNVIGTDSGESWITEMSNEELRKLFTLEA